MRLDNNKNKHLFYFYYLLGFVVTPASRYLRPLGDHSFLFTHAVETRRVCVCVCVCTRVCGISCMTLQSGNDKLFYAVFLQTHTITYIDTL